ncbi:MAG: twin arginine-targeting protein translocase TatC [Deltaproteobacteria bacterium GWA2_45_12]|nr:MAG: twin arginine-targeting protein translocase TatC [Deltaproteobacteria bacterium GWA2_45_12]
MQIIDHLSELRNRILKILVFLAVGAVIGLVFCKQIFFFLQQPMLKVLPPNTSFIATTPFESYTTYLKVSLLAGFFMASPFIFYQFWQFVSPGLHGGEKKTLIPFTLLSGLLFIGGALFGYFVVFPAGFYYINAILADTGIHLMPRMSDYLSTATTLLLAFGFCFELPLLIFLLGKLGLLTYDRIKQYRRYVIVLLFFVAAILTPGPDMISQCLLAIPLWILYEAGGVSLLLLKK